MGDLAAYQDIEVQQGSDWERFVTWRDAAGFVEDLSGCTAAMVWRRYVGGPEILRIDTAGGGIVLGGVAGTVQELISAAVSSAVPAYRDRARNRYHYQTEIYFASGRVQRIWEGRVILLPELVT